MGLRGEEAISTDLEKAEWSHGDRSITRMGCMRGTTIARTRTSTPVWWIARSLARLVDLGGLVGGCVMERAR